MTATADPSGARIADALERIATALEQSVLEGISKPGGLATPDDYVDFDSLPAAPPPRPVAVPAPQPQRPPAVGICPIHQTPWKLVPAGVSSKTGKAYDAFYACSTRGCDQRPPK